MLTCDAQPLSRGCPVGPLLLWPVERPPVHLGQNVLPSPEVLCAGEDGELLRETLSAADGVAGPDAVFAILITLLLGVDRYT